MIGAALVLIASAFGGAKYVDIAKEGCEGVLETSIESSEIVE